MLTHEVLCVLANYGTIDVEKLEFLHQGEVSVLLRIQEIAQSYERVRRFSQESHKRYPNSKAIRTLASTLVSALHSYEDLLISLEAKILSHDQSIVQDDSGQVPLSAILAEVNMQSTFIGLGRVLDHLENSLASNFKEACKPASLITLLHEYLYVGQPKLQEIIAKCLAVCSVSFHL